MVTQCSAGVIFSPNALHHGLYFFSVIFISRLILVLIIPLAFLFFKRVNF